MLSKEDARLFLVILRREKMTKFEMLLGILFMLMSAVTLAVIILMCMAMGV